MSTNRMRRMLAVACMSLLLAGSSLMVVYGENTQTVNENAVLSSQEESQTPESSIDTSGNSGTTGNEGSTGSEGSTGNEGSIGSENSTGEGSNTGDGGATGEGGNTGDGGTTGEGGNTGTEGTTGEGGNTGTEGTTGEGGNTGDGGTTGNGGSTSNGEESVYYYEAGDTPVDPDDESSYYTGSNTFQNDDNSDLVDDASVIEELPVSQLESSEESSEAAAATDGESSVTFGNNGGSGTLFWSGLGLILLGIIGLGSVVWMQVAPRVKARKAAAAGTQVNEEEMEDINSFTQPEDGEEQGDAPAEKTEPQAPADPKADTIDLDALMK